MIVRAWTSADGLTVQEFEHRNDATLSAWWTALPSIVGVMVIFSDRTRHRMESTEFYGLGASGSTRRRFWNGMNARDLPAGFDVRPGILVPDNKYRETDDQMDRSR